MIAPGLPNPATRASRLSTAESHFRAPPITNISRQALASLAPLTLPFLRTPYPTMSWIAGGSNRKDVIPCGDDAEEEGVHRP